jgi:hypothetical protein
MHMVVVAGHRRIDGCNGVEGRGGVEEGAWICMECHDGRCWIRSAPCLCWWWFVAAIHGGLPSQCCNASYDQS